MNKITVLVPRKEDLLSDSIECSPITEESFDCKEFKDFWHDEPPMFAAPKKYIEITDEEMLRKGKDNYGDYAPELSGWMEAFDYIKHIISNK